MRNATGRIIRALAVSGLLLGAAGRARADLTYTLNDSSDSLSATATISFVTDSHGNAVGIEISVTNHSSVHDSAHSISGVLLSINSATVGVPTALTEISGDKITYKKGHGNSYTSTTTGFHAYTPVSSDPDLHWYLNHKTTGDFRLDNVGYPHIKEMIITRDATVSSDVTNFDPYFNGTANFYLADAKLPTRLTTADIKGLSFEFGTGPEYTEAATGSGVTTRRLFTPLAVPEPSTMLPVAFAGLLSIGYSCRRTRARPSA